MCVTRCTLPVRYEPDALIQDKPVLLEVITEANLMQEERRKITSPNLALVLVHDLLLCKGIQAGDGPIKQAVLRHKTRLHGEFQKIKTKRGARSNTDLTQSEDPRAGGSKFCTAYLDLTHHQHPFSTDTQVHSR